MERAERSEILHESAVEAEMSEGTAGGERGDVFNSCAATTAGLKTASRPQGVSERVVEPTR